MLKWIEISERLGDKPICLVGFMGAGKTTHGCKLAREMKRLFIDTDDLIKKETGKTITEIFFQCGEAEFRKLECQAFFNHVAGKPVVTALGGGAFIQKAIQDYCLQDGITIYLYVDFQIIGHRLKSVQDRPLFKDLETTRSLYNERLQYYDKSQIKIQANSTVEYNLAKIQFELSNYLAGKLGND